MIKRYEEEVEDILAWIIGAEEKLNTEKENKEESLDTIQQIFQSLDDFTTESTDREKKIKDILKEGQFLMRSILTNEKGIREVQIQRDLLSNKWDELKNLIMDKQERLHNTLMSLQRKQLNDFSEWLKTAEHKISQFKEIETDLKLVKEQYNEHMQFQNEVRDHEPMVNTLTDMVIIIDECENPNYSSENLTEDLVDQLEALAEKWKNVCTIVEERETTLNIWSMLLEQEINFNNWVMKIEKRLQEIEKGVSEGQSKISFLNDCMTRLDKMKKDVEFQSDFYSEMFKEVQRKLKKINKDSKPAIRIKNKIDSLSNQWKSIMERRNLLRNSIQDMYDVQNEQNKLERKSSIRSQKSRSLDQSNRKRYKLDEWRLTEWKNSVIAFVKGLKSHEEKLGIVNDMNSLVDSEEEQDKKRENILLIEDLDIKEQEILIDEMQTEFDVEEVEYQNQVQLGNFLIEELESKTNEDTTILKELLQIMKSRWNKLKDVLDEKQLKIDNYTNLVKLYNECETLNRVLMLHNNRLDNDKIRIKKLNIKQNLTEINQIYEQCKVKNKTILTHHEKITVIDKEFKQILKKYPKFNQNETAKSITYFLNYWKETMAKINNFELEIENTLTINKLVKRKEEKLNETYPKLVNAIDILDKWLVKTYQIVYIAQLNLYWTVDEYEEQLNAFKELEKDINNEKKSLDYINETGERVIQLHFDSAWTPSFKSKIRDLNDKWNETIEILTTKIKNLECLKELVPKLNENINYFWDWLDNAEDFFKGSIDLEDFKTMEEQTDRYDDLVSKLDDEVLKSVDVIQEYYKKINKIIKYSEASLLTSNVSLNELSKQENEQQDNNRKFKDELKQKISEIANSWNLFREKVVNKRDIFKDFFKNWKKVSEKICNFEKEIEKIKSEKLMINDIDYVNGHCAKLEKTKEDLIKNLKYCIKIKNNLKDSLNDLDESAVKALEKMIHKLRTIESKCENLLDEISSICVNGQTVKCKYDELCKMYQSRANWLDKLEQIISRSTQELVDSEEICDYLQNLEDHLRNKPKDVSLEEVEKLLNDLNELFFDATDYVNKQEERWLITTAEASNRDKQLEQMLIETQEFEKQLLKLQQKLKYIESNLDENSNESNLDNDQLDVEQVEEKLKDANQTLNDLSEQLNKLMSEQRHLAAARFKEQLKYLQINYTELDKRFNELKNLPNITLEKDTLIGDLKKVYEELQNRQLTDSQTDLIQKKLYECSQPLQELENRINELQKSSLSLEDNQINKSRSSKASILKSRSDLDLSSPSTVTNELVNQAQNSELMFNQDLHGTDQNHKITPVESTMIEDQFDPQSNDANNYEQEQIPQAIEINLHNSIYLEEQEELFEDSVDYPWERCITNNYVPYYKNHDLQQTFFNHPNMTSLMEDLTELNEIYYAAYRTAIKLRTIQQTLFLNCIHITNMCKIFDTFDFLNDNLVSIPEMISVFKRIYEDISAKVTPITNYGLIIDMALNWVLNLYDLDRTGYIKLLAFKTSLVCLSRASIEEKYKVLYHLIADSKGYADRTSVGNLLKYMLEIPKLLGDVAAFGGSNFEPSIRSCFEEAQDKKQLNVKNFLVWLKKEPQSLVWLPLLHRLIIAEGSRHPIKCTICKAYPIVGFRYKCLKCFNTDMCQNCFLLRVPLNGHKNIHPIKEYCYVTGSGRKEVSDFSKIVRNKFKSSRKSFKKHFADSYLPVNSVLDNINSFEETNLNVEKNGMVSLLQYSPLSTNREHREDVHNKLEFYANKLAEAEEQNETNSLNVNSFNNSNLTNSDNLDSQRIDVHRNSNNKQKEFKLSKSNCDETEHNLITYYANRLAEANELNNSQTNNSSVLSNKFASLNDSLSKFNQTPSSRSSSTSTRRKLNGYLNSQDHLNSNLDEHQLVKSYCLILANSKDQINEVKNPNQVLTDLSENSKRELSFLIKQLEIENKSLENNYQALKQQKYGSPVEYTETDLSKDELLNGDLNQSREEMMIEKIQLEKKSKALDRQIDLLEAQNLQIQNQLSRLKLFLGQDCI